MDETVPKKLRISSLLEDILSPEFLRDPDNKLQYETFAQVKPFPYRYITNAFDPTFLRAVREEIKKHAKVNFKESDLFRVYQSMDLANLHGDGDDAVADKDETPGQQVDVDENAVAKTTATSASTQLSPQKIHPKDIPHVYQLRQVLYSPEFRHKMEAWTGLPFGTITDQVDCAANCHIQGCHLLCHDDVIGTRIISYIIYLTDDDNAWSAEEGGALELYDSTEINCITNNSNGDHGNGIVKAGYRVPHAIPVATVLPTFNSMAFFQVQPGFSFHAVQEVLGERPRLSLQGWFHAASPPPNMELATLQRLKNKDGSDSSSSDEGLFTPLAETTTNNDNLSSTVNKNTGLLSESDRTFLSKYLNETYLSDEAIREIAQRFEQDSSIQLRNFLLPQWEDRIRMATTGQDITTLAAGDLNAYQFGVDEEWKLVGPAHQQRFLEFTPIPAGYRASSSSSSSLAGSILHSLKTDLFQSMPYARYLSLLTSLGTPIGYRGRIRRFRRGLDYTVAHYGILTQTSVLDATLCFCADRSFDPSAGNGHDQAEQHDEADPDIESIWASGDVGGFECYVSADDEDAAAAADEYNEEDDTELLSVAPSNNTLSLVYRDPGTMRFIKYVSAAAPSSRWDITMEYEVADTDGSETDDGGERQRGDSTEVLAD